MSDAKWWIAWGGWMIAALVALTWAISYSMRPNPTETIIAHHQGVSEIYQDLILGLELQNAAHDAGVTELEIQKAQTCMEYVNDTDALCAALWRLSR